MPVEDSRSRGILADVSGRPGEEKTMTIERIEDWSFAPLDEDGRKSQRSGYVYIVQCGRNRMKIGYSSNPEWRARSIGYGGPATPLVLAVELFHPLAHRAEIWAHRKLTAEGRLIGPGRETFAVSKSAAIETVRWAIERAHERRPPPASTILSLVPKHALKRRLAESAGSLCRASSTSWGRPVVDG